ncbi:hypothetical protein KO500_07495 [Cellulophaga baltica]|uniref:hypothetical protein n=1 Tax=Cellulophaga TaxID=104264 RepID=UPI001C068464|nr:MULTISPECIES: hypothetical protein [Cellulophaga]MBU2996273.1 hypothetical protein [Cellulophaga baltica]MDO6767668.1 hypothetical protein [Cellulophaga sp. 1_MG-2023]
MEQTLLEKYIGLHPDFNSELESLSGKNKEKFIRFFKNEKQEANFLSLLSEFRFAQFLERESFIYEYEPTIGLKTPDFAFELTTKDLVYFDVKRFNISDLDKANDRKLYDLVERLKTIEKPYHVHLEQIEKELDFDLEITFEVIRKWLLQNTLNEGDSFNYENLFSMEIGIANEIKNHVLFSYSCKNPKIHISKLASDVLSKVRTYQRDIIDNGFPFFVGIDLTIDTLKDPVDYWIQFLGGSSMNTDTGIESFYTNSEFDGLTGLLIKYYNQFYWLNNPKNNRQIKFQNAKIKYK